MIVVLGPVVMALISGQLHRAEAGDPSHFGEDDECQGEQPEFGSARPARKDGILVERAHDENAKVCKCHEGAFACRGLEKRKSIFLRSELIFR